MSSRQDLPDEVSVELEAMQAIAGALVRLRDPRAPWRVPRRATGRLLDSLVRGFAIEFQRLALERRSA
jgi:hypothetical protein